MSTRWRDFARRWAVFAGFLLLWQLLTVLADNPYFPSPTRIAEAAGRVWFSGPAAHLWVTDAVTHDLLPSLGKLLAGWLIAIAVGVPLGLALGRSPVLTDYVSTMFFFARSVPATLLVPVFLVMFHIGTRMELVTILWGTIWPILLNTIDGARSVDDVKIETARAFRIGGRRWIFGVVLPAALPKVFAGLRLALAIAIILMIVSELTGSDSGIGYRLINAQFGFELDVMWAWIVLVSVLGYVSNLLLTVAERRALAWHPGFRSEVLD
ncbi:MULTISPECIES: ABC transporter permease [Amycolatopsis]|uniref:ABC-type nitrate/sulfonate/bicarbonate transport system, permease component n=2 Tax=Amycolatopsis TaxID=1813 RepID=A0A1I4B4Y6_9PSEU|nr:ABC transporter permease [Amycolatopsis sacchari]SFK63217.1 ABC-type nitrate/sulfonate/bicarbonate transport system, permease component [Amycolatopsis sacchari]